MDSLFWVNLLIGTLLGTCSGLGIGGGSLLILWLTIVRNMDALTARSINLMFFVPAAFIACLFRFRQGHIALRKLLPAIIAGSCFAAFFSYVRAFIDTHILRGLFGGLLLMIGLREILFRKKVPGKSD